MNNTEIDAENPDIPSNSCNIKTNDFLFRETCGLCRGSGLYGSSKCVVCDGTGVEKFLYPESAGPDAGCNHEAKIMDENGFAYCDDCGCPL